MLKKLIFILVLVLGLACFAACGNEEAAPEYPGLEKLVEATQELATNYNKVAEDAISNGWEYDDETVEEMDEIATVIEAINAGVVAPETFADGEIADYTKQVKTLSSKLNDLAKKVAEEYEIEGMTSTSSGE